MGSRYLLDDGSVVAGRDNAVVVSEQDVAAAGANATNTLPPGLFVGIASRETDFAINEIDDDPTLTTYGVYQLSRVEAIKALVPEAAANPKAMCKLDVATEVASATFQRLADAIAKAAGIDPLDPRQVQDQFWAFVGLAHNLGLGADASASGKHRAIAIVQTMGLDWEAVKANPPYGLVTQIQEHNGPYGDFVIEMVKRYPFEQTTAGDDGSDPSAAIDSYTFRKVIAIAACVILVLAAISIIFNRNPLKVVTG